MSILTIAFLVGFLIVLVAGVANFVSESSVPDDEIVWNSRTQSFVRVKK